MLYRLIYDNDPAEWPLSKEQIETLDRFKEKYEALNTCNEKLKRGTLHFGSNKKLKLEDIRKDFL